MFGMMHAVYKHLYVSGVPGEAKALTFAVLTSTITYICTCIIQEY